MLKGRQGGENEKKGGEETPIDKNMGLTSFISTAVTALETISILEKSQGT